MITTVTLNPAIDKTITVEHLEYGSVNRVDKGILDMGGKGINVSKVLGKLGDRTTAIGFLGNKNKHLVLELLEKEILETEFVYIKDETRTNTILVELDKGFTTNINEEGFSIETGHLKDIKAMVNKYAEHSQYMVFSGSASKGCQTDIYKELIHLVREKTITVLDADDDLLLEGLKASPYLIKPNIHELENAFDTRLETDEDIARQSRKIITDYGVKMVLISMGGEGCILVTENEVVKAMPLPVEVKSTVGAGDSFVAGFVHGLANEMPLKDCLAYGTVCGALAVAREGVGNFDMDEFDDLLAQVVIEICE